MSALEAFARSLWLAEGPTVPFLTIPYPTRMAVVRLASGDLFVWSPIELTPALAAELEALGPVRHLVSPNKIHHLFLGPWQERWPDARLYAPPGLAKKRRDLRFDAELGDASDPAWADDLDPIVFGGSLFMEEVVFFHHASRTALVCDLVQRHDPTGVRGLKGFVMRLDGLVGERGSAPREWRASFLRRAQIRAARERLLSLHPERLVIAHGQCAHEGAAEILTRAMAWM